MFSFIFLVMFLVILMLIIKYRFMGWGKWEEVSSGKMIGKYGNQVGIFLTQKSIHKDGRVKYRTVKTIQIAD